MQWSIRKQQSLNATTPVAQFYGPGMSTHNLEIVSRFFEKYPEYTERAFLMVKVNLHPRLDSTLLIMTTQGGYNPDKGLDNSYVFCRTVVYY